MTLDDLASDLPNGFHDAEVRKLTFDIAHRVARIDLDVWIGRIEAPPELGRETYRPAALDIHGVAYLVIEAPDPTYPYAKAGPISVDLCEPVDSGRLPPAQAGEFAARFFVNDWNSFISVSARDAALRWTGEPYEAGPRRVDECVPPDKPMQRTGR
ncbi:MAG: hypothetical protein Q8S73_31485 [Deltaproteobacteria bacterium]|nr:hypothetical protein [Myxococcales bacterium]MDP3218669.1 hypothetical protein [Deltaproteobacteria bacterium]